MQERIFYTNLHTHTPLCRHASGSGKDFCSRLPEEIRTIGFADHIPFPDGRFKASAMSYSQMPEYFAYLENARQEFPDVEIIAGFEAEWCPELGKDFYEEYYFSRGIRYLIGSAHYSAAGNAHFYSYDSSDLAAVKGFVTRTVEILASGVFIYAAHPDAYLMPFRQVTDNLRSGFMDIIQAAKELDVPLELNCNGIRHGQTYPAMEFWEMAAAEGIRTVIGSDAHSPDALYDSAWHKGVQMLSRLGIVPCNEEVLEAIR